MLASKTTRPMIVKRPVIQCKFAFAPFRPHIRLPMFTVCTYPCRIASDLQIDNCVLVNMNFNHHLFYSDKKEWFPVFVNCWFDYPNVAINPIPQLLPRYPANIHYLRNVGVTALWIIVDYNPLLHVQMVKHVFQRHPFPFLPGYNATRRGGLFSTGRTPLLSTRRIHPHECGTTPGQCASASVNHPCGCACSTEDSCDQQPSAAGKFRRGIRPSAPTSCRRTPFLLLAFPRVQLCPVLPFDLNVNLQPFLECHCPCTSFLPRLARTTRGGRSVPRLSASICDCVKVEICSVRVTLLRLFYSGFNTYRTV